MKKIFLALVLTITLGVKINGQSTNNQRFIEVVSEAEVEAIPDLITIAFELEESADYALGQPENATMPVLEKAIKDYLKKNKIDGKSLTETTQPQASFFGKSLSSETKKSYTLELTNMDLTKTVVNALDSIGAKACRIDKLATTKESQYKDQAAAEALKNAKAKAEKMLAVYNEKIGQVLEVRDVLPSSSPYDKMVPDGMADMQKSIFSSMFGGTNNKKTTITIKYTVIVKFAIN
jgi:uncharacterized protein YggE